MNINVKKDVLNIAKRNFDILLYYLISGLFCMVLFVARKLEYQLFLRVAAIIVIVYFFLTILYFYRIKQEKIISLHFLFLLFIFVFNFGNIVINLFSPNHIYRTYDFLHHYSSLAITNAIIYSFFFVCLIAIGYLIGFSCTEKRKDRRIILKKTIIDQSNNALLLFACIILIFSMPVELYISINKFIIGITQGYMATYEFNVSGILVQISQFHIIGLIMLALAFKDNNKIVNLIYFVTILYECIIMLSGNRGQQVIRICFLLIIYFNYLNQIKIGAKKLIVFGLIAFLGLTILMNISKIRLGTHSDLFQYFKNLIFAGSNPVIAILDEFGYSLFTLSLCYGQMPAVIPFSNGMTYLASLITILPNINSFTNALNGIASFVPQLGIEGIGGSIIAESYFNFSNYGLILAIPIGIFTVVLSKLLVNSLNEKKYYIFSYLILPATSLLWWVRDSFTNIPRMLVYSAIFLIICKWLTIKIFNKMKDRKGGLNNDF